MKIDPLGRATGTTHGGAGAPDMERDMETDAETGSGAGRIDLLLYGLLAVCIARLWLTVLGSSFWEGEIATAFLVRLGPSHPSFDVAPQVPQSIYYWLPRVMDALFGFSELAYRVPSVLLMGATIWMTGKLAARLIHPQAGWFAAFACLALPAMNFQAAEARPYAMGTCVVVASILFLVRWLDTGIWREGLLFLFFAALLWRIHMLYWPVYILFVLYAGLRLARGETVVGRTGAVSVFALLGIALVPVVLDAMTMLPGAQTHVIGESPGLAALIGLLQPGLIIVCGLCALLWGAIDKPATRKKNGEDGRPRQSRAERKSGLRHGFPPTDCLLILGMWLVLPLALFLFSRLTGIPTFLPRYLYAALPGAALVSTGVAGVFLPVKSWKGAALFLGAGALATLGMWHEVWPPHTATNWRSAAETINEIVVDADTPVICPSPFIEASSPVWTLDYPLPGFLYSPLEIYPIAGKPYLFPTEFSPEGEQYAERLSTEILAGAGRFLIYSRDEKVQPWLEWFSRREEFSGWTHQSLGPFGTVEVVLFEKRPDGREQIKRGD